MNFQGAYTSAPSSPVIAENVIPVDQTEAAARSQLAQQLEKLVQSATRQQLAADSTNIFEDVLQHVEAAMIATVLEATDHNITQAARRLGISRPTLRSKLRSRMPFK
jgi:DNA-binding protein Fis